MLMTRCAKVAMTATLSLFALLVAFNNVTDYGSNFAFVQHVLRMDTTFVDSAARWRAIGQPLVWHATYLLIIATEVLAGVLMALGAWAMWRARHARMADFARAKQWAVAGLLAGFVLWFAGFMVVGGEWFLMWQSHEWNGQDSAARFYTAILGVLIFVNQADADLPA